MSESVCLFVSLSLSLFCCRGCLLRLDCCGLMHDLFRSHRLPLDLPNVWRRRRSRQVQKSYSKLSHTCSSSSLFFSPRILATILAKFASYSSSFFLNSSSMTTLFACDSSDSETSTMLRGVDGFEDVVWHWTFLHEAGFSLASRRANLCDDDSTSSSSFSNYELDNKASVGRERQKNERRTW